MESLLPYLRMVTVPHIIMVGLKRCWIMECLLPYLRIVTVPHTMVGLKRCWIIEVSD